MQRISEFKQKTGTQIHLSFMGSKESLLAVLSGQKTCLGLLFLKFTRIYLAMHSGLFSEISTLAIGIVDDLNLKYPHLDQN
jgi:hypothetical protein